MQADVWSLGMTILEASTARHPHLDGASPFFDIVLHMATSLQRPVPVPDWLPPDLHHWLSWALELAPGRRATAAELLQHPWLAEARNLQPAATGPLCSKATGSSCEKAAAQAHACLQTQSTTLDGCDSEAFLIREALLSEVGGIAACGGIGQTEVAADRNLMALPTATRPLCSKATVSTCKKAASQAHPSLQTESTTLDGCDSEAFLIRESLPFAFSDIAACGETGDTVAEEASPAAAAIPKQDGSLGSCSSELPRCGSVSAEVFVECIGDQYGGAGLQDADLYCSNYTARSTGCWQKIDSDYDDLPPWIQVGLQK